MKIRLLAIIPILISASCSNQKNRFETIDLGGKTEYIACNYYGISQDCYKITIKIPDKSRDSLSLGPNGKLVVHLSDGERLSIEEDGSYIRNKFMNQGCLNGKTKFVEIKGNDKALYDSIRYSIGMSEEWKTGDSSMPPYSEMEVCWSILD